MIAPPHILLKGGLYNPPCVLIKGMTESFFSRFVMKMRSVLSGLWGVGYE